MMDRELFDQIGLDSGALTLLGNVVHQLDRPGIYRLSVQQSGGEVADAVLEVTDDADAEQITVDLAGVDDSTDTKAERTGCCDESTTRHRMRPGGYVLFHVGSGPDAYAAVLGLLGDGGPEVVFDSRSLQRGDRFVATVLRPGRYVVSNLENGSNGVLEVAYPGREAPVELRAEPIEVSVADRGVDPAEVTTKPARPVVYVIQTAARMRIELQEPYDRDSR